MRQCRLRYTLTSFATAYGWPVAVLLLAIPDFVWWGKLLLIILPAAVCGMVLYVLIQRIRELRSGETDDLDKY